MFALVKLFSFNFISKFRKLGFNKQLFFNFQLRKIEKFGARRKAVHHQQHFLPIQVCKNIHTAFQNYKHFLCKKLLAVCNNFLVTPLLLYTFLVFKFPSPADGKYILPQACTSFYSIVWKSLACELECTTYWFAHFWLCRRSIINHWDDRRETPHFQILPPF